MREAEDAPSLPCASFFLVGGAGPFVAEALRRDAAAPLPWRCWLAAGVARRRLPRSWMRGAVVAVDHVGPPKARWWPRWKRTMSPLELRT